MLTVFTVVLVAVIPCSATTVYVSADDDNLYTIDPTTGATTLVGNMGAQMTDIALRNGSMFGTDYPASGPEQPLYAIGPRIRGGDIEGVHGRVPKCAAVWLRWDALRRWWRPRMRTGGALLRRATAYTRSPRPLERQPWSAQEFMIPPATLSSRTAFPTFTSFDNASTDQLFKMDATTGAGTLVGDIARRTYSVYVRREAGTLYGFNDIGNNVISINTATGAGTSIANYSSRFEILGTATTLRSSLDQAAP